MDCVPLFIVSTAPEEVTDDTAPFAPELLVTTEYVPASAITGLVNAYVLEVAPEILTPSLRH